MVRMRHPKVADAIEVPESAVGMHARSGWVVDASEGERPDCPTCGRPWPAGQESESTDQQDKAPAESGASSSGTPRRRRQSKESD